MYVKRVLREIWSFHEQSLKDGTAKGEKMAYYSSPKKYEIATGKTFTTHCPCIHSTGSVKGMVNLKFWDKDSDKVRHGNYIYNQPS